MVECRRVCIIFDRCLLAHTLSLPRAVGIFARSGGVVAIWNSFKVRSAQQA